MSTPTIDRPDWTLGNINILRTWSLLDARSWTANQQFNGLQTAGAQSIAIRVAAEWNTSSDTQWALTYKWPQSNGITLSDSIMFRNGADYQNPGAADQIILPVLGPTLNVETRAFANPSSSSIAISASTAPADNTRIKSGSGGGWPLLAFESGYSLGADESVTLYMGPVASRFQWAFQAPSGTIDMFITAYNDFAAFVNAATLAGLGYGIETFETGLTYCGGMQTQVAIHNKGTVARSFNFSAVDAS